MNTYPGSRWWQKPSAGYFVNPAGDIPPPTTLFLFNENGGLTAFDIAGRNNATLDSTSMWAPGNFGPAIDTLSGTKKATVSSPNVNVNDIMGINTANPTYATILAWAKLSATGQNGALAYKSNNVNIGWYFQVTSAPALQLVGAPSGAFFVMTSTGLTPAVGTWYQYAAVVNGPMNATAGHRLYINGLDRTNTPTAGSGSYTSDASTALTIGNGGSGSGAFSGQIDHLAIWKGIALTAAQIERLYWEPFAYLAKAPLRRHFPPGAVAATTHQFPLMNCGG